MNLVSRTRFAFVMHEQTASVEAEPPSSPSARLEGLRRWLVDDLRLELLALTPVSGDASFRRYFRAHHSSGSFIVMDAPPQHEDCRSFLAIAWLFRDLGLNVPEILEMDLERGYLLLSDFGDQRYLEALDANSVEHLYGDALDALERLQTLAPRDGSGLPEYDRALLMGEMSLFREWFLERHLGLSLSDADGAMLDEALQRLADEALAQPRVCVHRDYHSRNLMITEANSPGILDFQDAVLGPVTYDLVSLLRDCYIAWPRSQVEAWALQYVERPAIRELVGEVDGDTWLRWFDLMGLQRHLKVAGIFSRLWHRDGKDGYLADIPRTLRYVQQVTSVYPEFEALNAFLERAVLPHFEQE